MSLAVSAPKYAYVFKSLILKYAKKKFSTNKNNSTKLLFYYTFCTNVVQCENLARGR